MIVAGLLSDIYDGILARRWGTATAALRIADSAIDIVFYFGVLVAVIERHWPALRERNLLVTAVVALEVLHGLFDRMKFGRISSYHSYAAKVWGLLLAASAVALLGFDQAGFLLTTALAWGILCQLEGFAMSVMLPEWTHDVKTLRSAWLIRKQMLQSQSAESAYQ